jgi:hypothetical protein
VEGWAWRRRVYSKQGQWTRWTLSAGVYRVVLRGCEAEREEEDVDHREMQVRLLRNGRIIKGLEDFVVCKFCQGSPSTLETRILSKEVFSQVQESLFSSWDPKKIAPRSVLDLLVPALPALTPSCASSDTTSQR